MNLILSLFFLFCYLSFWYSSLKIFKVTEKIQLFHRRVFKILTIILWNYSLYTLYFQEFYFWGNIYKYNFISNLGSLALLFIITSLLLFWLSARTIRKTSFDVIFSENTPNFILKEGPYKYVRHPFYTSYILCYLALIILNYNYYVSLIAFSLVVYYVWAAISEERKFISSSLMNAEFKSYKEKTKMFFPYIY